MLGMVREGDPQYPQGNLERAQPIYFEYRPRCVVDHLLKFVGQAILRSLHQHVL